MRELRIEQSFTDLETRSMDRYLKEVNRIGLVNIDEEAQLAELVQKGNTQALQKLVQANLRFVISVAKKYQGQGVPLADLVNEGNLGLMHAAYKFDHSKGFKFITYAVYWIRRNMYVAISEQNRMIRMPLNEVLYQGDMRRAMNALQHVLHREPSNHELAEYLGVSEQRILDTISYNTQFVSSDQPLAEDGYTTLIEMLPCNSPGPDAALLEPAVKNDIKEFVKNLPERDRAIMEYSYGLNGRNALCIREMALSIGVTGERIRQIRKVLLDKLRRKFIKEYSYEDCLL